MIYIFFHLIKLKSRVCWKTLDYHMHKKSTISKVWSRYQSSVWINEANKMNKREINMYYFVYLIKSLLWKTDHKTVTNVIFYQFKLMLMSSSWLLIVYNYCFGLIRNVSAFNQNHVKFYFNIETSFMREICRVCVVFHHSPDDSSTNNCLNIVVLITKYLRDG